MFIRTTRTLTIVYVFLANIPLLSAAASQTAMRQIYGMPPLALLKKAKAELMEIMRKKEAAKAPVITPPSVLV